MTLVLHRLVLAFIYAALRGPRSASTVKTILDNGRLDPAVLHRYAADHHAEFWLFDEKKPFLQDPRLADEFAADHDSPSPIHQLFRETAGPDGKVLFDHTISDHGQGVPAAQAAQYLLADQFYGLQDGRGYSPSMLSFGAATLVAGGNLFETLALNLIPYNSESPIKTANLDGDAPFWEQDQLDPRPEPLGWLDYLTRPYRRLLLVATDEPRVTSVYRKAAKPLNREWRDMARDPWVAYQVTDKGARAVALKASKALWRDSHALFQHLSIRGIGAPGYVNLLAQLGRQPALHVFGVVAPNNQVRLWRQERLPLSTSYLRNQDLLAELQGATELAEDIARTLWAQIAPLRRLIAGLDCERPYWASLDHPFRELVGDLAAAWERGEASGPMRAWAAAVRGSANEAFETAAHSAETAGRGLRAAAEARSLFRVRLNQKLERFLPPHGG